ncbi:MAG: UbiD family decarboxylase [Deltaproteobacteria bacterium]|nr:UbiD family decarboxylase [Deltaproteobacteria bacterium]
MAYYRDLREWLDFLDSRGHLRRISRPIDKDTEMHPVVRLQFRGLQEADRKGWLFENVVDVTGRRYDIPVALAVMAPNRLVYALGMGVSSAEEISAKWAHAQIHPVPPRSVSLGPCQELIYEGEALQNAGGVGMLPVPISTPGFDSAPFLSSGHWVTKDPETGDLNFGTYRGQIKSPTRIGLFAFPYQDISNHWSKAQALGKPLEAAIVIGCTPNLSYCSTARLPVPEYIVAGGIAGEPVEVVRCRTVDLLVPAHSEIVIEGIIPTDEIEPEGPFGEFTGYMAHREPDKFMNVTCITRRRDAIFQAFLSQFPPSESSVLRGVGQEGRFYKLLTADHGMKGILEVALPEAAGGHGVCVVRIDKSAGGNPMEALRALADLPRAAPKILIAVDEDIDPRDAESVNWAMSYRVQPHRDVEIRDIQVSTALDFSLTPPESRGEITTMKGSAILIDATRKWSYPPTSLPAREYMEKAQSLWRELGLPAVQLKKPWFGYNLGSWSQEDTDDAVRALRGEHYRTGELRERQRVRLQKT